MLPCRTQGRRVIFWSSFPGVAIWQTGKFLKTKRLMFVSPVKWVWLSVNCRSGKAICCSFREMCIRDSGNRGQTIDWTGAANVGLEGPWGWVRLGRVNEMSSEFFTELDPFLQAATGSALAKYNLLRSEQLSNTVRYDSPEFAGFVVGLTYTLSADDHKKPVGVNSDIYNAGFGGSLRYSNGPVSLMTNYNRQADSNKSFVWNIGGAYTLGDWRFSAGYQGSQLKNLSLIPDLDVYKRQFLDRGCHCTGSGGTVPAFPVIP